MNSISAPNSPPVVAGGTAYFATGMGLVKDSSYVHAINAETGQHEWSFRTNGRSLPPAVAGESIFFGDSAGHVYALNAETGKEQWRFKTGENVNTSPAVANGTVYVGNATGDIYALNAESGQQQWRFQTYARGTMSDPAVVDGTVYVGSSNDTDATDYVYALSAKTGRKLWRFGVGSDVSTSLAVAEGTLYVTCSSGISNIGYSGHENYVYALNVKTGQIKWSFEANGRTFGVPSVNKGSVYVGSSGASQSGYVYSIDVKTGQQQWRFETSDSNPDVVVVGSRVYAEDGFRIYALNAETGRKQWEVKPNAEPSYLTVVRGTVYIGSYSGPGYVYAME